MEIQRRLAFFLLLPAALSASNPESWIPARWTGGPLEIAQRTTAKTLPADPAVRESIASWYEPTTLNLLQGSPVNCLLVTWSAGADAGLERSHQALVKGYAAEAQERGLTVLGLIQPGSDANRSATAAADARLDGVVLDGEFPASFVEQVGRALASANSSAVVISYVGPGRAPKSPISMVEGVSPSARNLTDMGIRGAPSSEPWIESNAWAVRSFRQSSPWRPVWVTHQPEGGTASEYARTVADAALAGGRWVVALDDALRARLQRRDANAIGTWQAIGDCIQFAEDHAEWRTFAPFGGLGIIVDTAAADRQVLDEFLKLVARRQVPYRIVPRSRLNAGELAGLRAVLAIELATITVAERKLLTTFAESGRLVVAGPSWGAPASSSTGPQDAQPYLEFAVGKGRVTIYKEPDPEAIAREMKELLSHKEAGMVAFNVPSSITYASTDGRRVLVQLLNYSNTPSTAITIRVNGTYKSARLIAPDAEPALLEMALADGQTDVTIPKISMWGGVLLE